MRTFYNEREDLLFEDEILITVEEINKAENTIIFDFIDSKHFERFLKSLDVINIKSDGASMILFYNYSITKKFQEGVYYSLRSKHINELTSILEQQDNSAVLIYKINLNNRDLRDYVVNTKVSKPYIDNYNEGAARNDYKNLVSLLNRDNIAKSKEFIARNVRQGSWNEFVFEGKPRLVFDLGTSYLENKESVRAFICLRDLDYQHSQPVIIISHWDVDHYHLLLEAEDATIRAISALVYRSKIPNKTSRRLIERFKNLNPNALFPLEEQDPSPDNSSETLTRIISGANGISIYNGSRNRSRNKSGILLTYMNAKMAIILSADFDYMQLDKCVLPDFNYYHHHYLVVPHHGGFAGKFIYNNIKCANKDAIISVGGRYSYNHPLEDVIDKLMLKKFKPVNFKCRTQLNYHLDLS